MTPIAHQSHHYVMGDKAFYCYGGYEKSDRENGCNEGIEGLTGIHCIEPYYSYVVKELEETRLESLYRVFRERDIGGEKGKEK